mmetsp:Transcript_21111/g.42905  ORF Transcript_21111/g.42905 Transcript_21111/m.42905 type:complete len:287 (-) Transcript_21111:445-1305(-)
MGLGGLTRDSIVGLNNLVHDDDDDGQGNYGGNSNEYEHQGHRRNLSLNNGSKSFGVTSGNAGHCGDFLFIDGQLQESQSQPAEQSVALTSLNDCGKETGRPQRQSSFQGQPGRPTASSSASPRVAPEAHSGTAAAYQFHYEDYTDYYAEDFAPYNYDYDYGYDGFAEGRGEEGEGKNIFCCLFAPWLAKARPETIDRDEGEGNKADALQSAPDLQNEATLQQQQQQQQQQLLRHQQHRQLHNTSEKIQSALAPHGHRQMSSQRTRPEGDGSRADGGFEKHELRAVK